MSYLPSHGDIIYLEFDPQKGHEQKGRRPALIVSNSTFNAFTNLAIVCPITNTDRGFPLHVSLDERTKTSGVIMCEQLKSLDIKARGCSFVEVLPDDLLEEVVDIINGFIEIER